MFNQQDSPTETSTSTLTLVGESKESPKDSPKAQTSPEERTSRSRRSSKQSIGEKGLPPRPCSVPRRSIPRRMSSLEEKPQVFKKLFL